MQDKDTVEIPISLLEEIRVYILNAATPASISVQQAISLLNRIISCQVKDREKENE
jgi:hypothetical protein